MSDEQKLRRFIEHVKEFSIHVLSKAIRGLTFSEYGDPFAHAFAVIQAAHAAELVLKAKLLELDPTSIFNFKRDDSSRYEKDFFLLLQKNEKSLNYSVLPRKLESLGLKLDNVDKYYEFGILRNKVAHLYVPNVAIDKLTLEFALHTDAWAYSFWNMSALETDTMNFEEVITAGYLTEVVRDHGLALPPHALHIIEKLSTSSDHD